MADPILDAIAQLGEKITKLGEDLIGRINAGNERLVTAIDGIRDDLTVLGATNERIRMHGDNTRDEVRAVADSLANIERLLLKHGSRLDALERR